MKSTGSRGHVGGCLVLAGGFGVESEPTLRILPLTSSPALDRAGDDGRCIWLRVAPTPLRRETDGKAPPERTRGTSTMRTPQPPPPEVPSRLPSLRVPLLTGTSPAGLSVRIVPGVTERSGQASQGSEQGSPGATRQNDRALRRDTRELPVRGKVNQPRLSQEHERTAGAGSHVVQPPPPSTVTPPPAPFPPAREPGGSPIHGPCRTFRALRSPRRCRLHYGGPGTLLTASLPALHCGLALPGKVHIPARAPFHLGAHPGVAFLLRLVGSPAARLLGAQDLSSTLSPHFMEEGSCTGTGALSGQGYICGGHY